MNIVLDNSHTETQKKFKMKKMLPLSKHFFAPVSMIRIDGDNN